MISESDYLLFKEHLKQIINLKEKCRSLSDDEKFKYNDVRNTFYRQVMNIINDYYLGMFGPFFMARMKTPLANGTLAPYLPDEVENSLISNFGFLCEQSYLKTWHDMKKVSLVFSLWIIFEDSIDVIYSYIVDEKEVENLKNGTYSRIKKYLEDKLSEEDLLSIQAKLKSDYIGINNKYNYILNRFSLNKALKKELKEIREFLHFFNVLRNILHTNGRPMKDYNFKLSFGEFKFEKNKHIDFFTPDVLFICVEKFVGIFNFIRENLQIGDEIFNTASLIENSYSEKRME